MRWICASVVPPKGVNRYSAHAAGRGIDLSGLRRITIKSDQELALKELLRAATVERLEESELQLEESPFGESKSEGEVERAIQTVRGHVRTLKLVGQRTYDCNIREGHPIWHWLVKYVGI